MAVVLAVVLGASADAAMLGLVANGDFEEPDPAAADFPPWLVWGGATALDTFVSTSNPHGGLNHATSGPIAPGGISQDLATTLGTDYVLSFWLFNAEATPNAVTVTWEGVPVFIAANLPQSSPVPDPSAYTLYSFNVTANHLPDVVPGPVALNTSRLRFTFDHPQGWFDLDDVIVTQVDPNAVPEPASLTIWSLGALALGLGYRRRMRIVRYFPRLK